MNPKALRPAPVQIDGRSRRMFLKGAGGLLLALPFLDSLLPQPASAQTAIPKRFICMKSFSTQLVKRWHPAFSGNGYQLHDAVYGGSKADGTTLLTAPLGGGPYTQAPLSDLVTPSGLSAILGAKLNPFVDKLTLIRGLDFLPTVNHNFGGLLGNFSSCTNATPCTADSLLDVPTIDQVLAYSPKFYPSVPGLRQLHISQGVVDSMSYTDYGQVGGAVEQMKARTNPRDVFNDLFAGVTLPDSGAPPAENPDRLLVDKVVGEYNALRRNTRMSAADVQKLDQHIDLLHELEMRLGAGVSASCSLPAEPDSMDNDSGTDPTDIKTKWDLFIDLVVAGITCDRTRIVTMGVHKALGPGPDPSDSALYGHYHSEDASGGTWHGLAHDWSNENARRMLEGINRWIAEELFAKLVEKLDVVESGDSTFLDNSLVYWGNELGFNHIAYSVPCLLAGSAGGAIRTGRYLDYVDWSQNAYFSQEDGNVIRGIPHNRFLVSVLQAMGLSPEDYERDGQAGYGSTSTAGKDPSAWPVNYDLSQIGQGLPGLGA